MPSSLTNAGKSTGKRFQFENCSAPASARMPDAFLVPPRKSRMRDMARSNNVLVGEMSLVLALALVESVAVDLQPSPAVLTNVKYIDAVPLTPSPSPQPQPQPEPRSSSSQLSEQTIVILSISLVAVLALAVLFCWFCGKRCMRRCCVCCYDEDEEPLVRSSVRS